MANLYNKYVAVLIWIGRVLAVANLFLPFGMFLFAITLLLTEAVGLLYRLYLVSVGEDENP